MSGIEKRKLRGSMLIVVDVGSPCGAVPCPLVSPVRDGRIFGPFFVATA